MPVTKEAAKEKVREFLRRLDEVNSDLTSNQAIFLALNSVTLVPDPGGVLSENMIARARRKNGSPTGTTRNWDRLIAAVCQFPLKADSLLLSLQTEIKVFLNQRDEPRNDAFVHLFARDQRAPNHDPRLVGDYLMYRQVTDSGNVEKALFSVQPVAGTTGMRFQMVLMHGDRKYRSAEGRAIKMSGGFTFIGSLFNVKEQHTNGIAVAHVTEPNDETHAQINRQFFYFLPGLYTICADYIQPSSTKFVLVRVILSASAHDKRVKEKVDIFLEDKKTVSSLEMGDAVSEIYHLLEDRVEKGVIQNALSNETGDVDTLHSIKTIW